MNGLLLFMANETMMFVTIIIVFPGFMPPKDGMEAFMIGLILIPMSFVWPVFLIMSPFVFLILWLCGDWTPSDHLSDWPWKQLFGRQPS